MLITCGTKRHSLLVVAVFTLLLLFVYHGHANLPQISRLSFGKPPPKQHERLNIQDTRGDELKQFHWLLPSSSGDVSICKTLLSASVLGYPVPTLISWNKTFEEGKLPGGGRHLDKIDAILQWLEQQAGAADNELVLVADPYGGFNYQSSSKEIEEYLEGDLWFQLPLEVLVQRYHAVMDKANQDLKVTMGKAYDQENVRQKILFGSSKQCTPSGPDKSACYPIPESPLPTNLYGRFTDQQGFNNTTQRARFLSSAYTIGTIGDMRALFRRAHVKAQSARNAASAADFPEASLGSDQAIFSQILGEQEFQREVIRRRHGATPRKNTIIEGAQIDDVLDPAFKHEVLLEKKGNPIEDEFGIVVDYWSDVGMETALGGLENDARWIAYKLSVPEQLLSRGPRQKWSCVPQVAGFLPSEVIASTGLPRAAVSESSQYMKLHGWDEIPLFTNICLDTIPVMVNHNGDKQNRDRDWPEMWMQPHARRLIEEILDREEGEGGKFRGGAIDATGGDYLSWKQLCPASVEREVFQDYYESGL